MKNIGIDVKPSSKSCEDELCPFHGSTKLRGRLIRGKIASAIPGGNAVIEKQYFSYVDKYMRYEKRRSKIHAHLPPCIEVKKGDTVTIAECRPLTKTAAFVVIEKVGE
ncbi:MAG: 30S ribosomal protein S17 [Thaumarchaeota archaeon]|nr:30S ribosomal protein S17 [Nitrososphaerota archaeon]MCL5318003.1 30S ribosomal protein S17 [Nitrososphaerota archaeon]